MDLRFVASNSVFSESPEYRIKDIDGCRLIFGAFPVRDLPKLSKGMPKNAVIDQDVARIYAATMAFGSMENLDAIRAKGVPEAIDRYRSQFAGRGLSDEAIRWLAIGFRGVSSDTMFSRILGIDVLDGHRPAAPDSAGAFIRCRKLVNEVPEIGSGLQLMRGVSPLWEKFITNWDSICTTLDEEAPDWNDPQSGKAKYKTHEMVKQLINEVEASNQKSEAPKG